MSVLIRGIEPSTRCFGCDFEIYGQYCVLLEKYTNDTRKTGRLDNCPVVGLPEKHGRLIDADEFGNRMHGKWTVYDYEGLGKTPTVIEAEGDE